MQYYGTTKYIISSNECLWFVVGFISAMIFFFLMAYMMEHIQKKKISQRISRVQKAHQKQTEQYNRWIHNKKAEVLNKSEEERKMNNAKQG